MRTPRKGSRETGSTGYDHAVLTDEKPLRMNSSNVGVALKQGGSGTGHTGRIMAAVGPEIRLGASPRKTLARGLGEIRVKYVSQLHYLARAIIRGDDQRIYDEENIIGSLLSKVREEVDIYYGTSTVRVTRSELRELVDLKEKFLDEISRTCYAFSYIIRVAIGETEQSKDLQLSPDEKWAELERFAKEYGGEGVAEYGKLLFGDRRQPALPTEAPEKYQGLRGPETPPEFVKRVYEEWLGRGLTRAHVRKLDPKLSTAIDNWLSRAGNEWPAEVDLPTVKELNDRMLAKLEAGEPAGDFSLREMGRIRSAMQRRHNVER